MLLRHSFNFFEARLKNFLTVKSKQACSTSRHISYIQGQEPEPKIREYFYYIDHEGMLFLDDAKMKNFTSCFKEKQFLKFFFSRVKLNDTKRYNEHFPYLSLCGRERNFIRCDDTPIVFTHVISDEKGNDRLSYAHAADQLSTDFLPHKIYMNPQTGRVYHPAWPKVGGIGLIRSKLAIELSRNFEFVNGESESPTHFSWRGQRWQLENEWVIHTQRFGMFEE
ncbi:UPF0598 protein CG30010 [Ceratitis capitata]|uniref:(Mediterranean fruit fly) hypothetical protein n=1 Tax=Ceratitis capitata TaxID=7213 RepID=A0A811VD42_CERCA|nr:UPF0598 protein CG30010 [Ceratitis capitata]CAD7012132.1 unnamed protein product [Ceratitis capitata]